MKDLPGGRAVLKNIHGGQAFFTSRLLKNLDVAEGYRLEDSLLILVMGLVVGLTVLAILLLIFELNQIIR